MTEPGSMGRERVRAGRRRLWVASLISLGAVGLAAVHLARPNLKIDTATLVLAVVAVIPWLGDLFDSIELPGGTKLQYRQLQERVEAVEQRTVEARLAVDDASRQARVAMVANRESALSGDADQDVARLVGEFTDLRRGQPSGAARTYRQELIFAELARLTPRLPDFDVTASLASTEGGVRLAAYSRLYALPEEGFLPALVDAATAETLHFNQYWALQAISAVIDATGPGNVRLETVRRLRTYLPQLPHDSDRSAVLRAILGRLETRT